MYSLCGHHCLDDDDDDFQAKIEIIEVDEKKQPFMDHRNGTANGLPPKKQYNTMVTMNGSVQITEIEETKPSMGLADIPEVAEETDPTSPGFGKKPELKKPSGNNNDNSPPLPPKEKDLLQAIAKQMAPLAQMESDNIAGSRPCSIAVPNFSTSPNLSTISEEAPPILNRMNSSTPVREDPSNATPASRISLGQLPMPPVSPLSMRDFPDSSNSLNAPDLPPKGEGYGQADCVKK
jgi:hypothetical protein